MLKADIQNGPHIERTTWGLSRGRKAILLSAANPLRGFRRLDDYYLKVLTLKEPPAHSFPLIFQRLPEVTCTPRPKYLCRQFCALISKRAPSPRQNDVAENKAITA